MLTKIGTKLNKNTGTKLHIEHWLWHVTREHSKQNLKKLKKPTKWHVRSMFIDINGVSKKRSQLNKI